MGPSNRSESWPLGRSRQRPHIVQQGHSSNAMTTTDLTLSPSAAQRIQAIGAREGRPVMLRVAVEGGGCSGFQYQFDLVDEAQADDIKVERDGAAALVDE